MVTIYQADVWCDSCGRAIEADLRAAGKAPPDYGPPWDTDDWPSHGHPGEATDCPQHCGSGEDCLEAEVLPSGRKVGAVLGDELTEYGVDYVREAVQEGGEVAELWAEVFADYL